MNDTFTYEWTEKLAAASLRTLYKDKIGRTGLLTTGGLIFFIIGVCNYFFLSESMGIAVCFIGFILFISPLRIYLSSRRLAKDTARLMEDPKITLTITDDSITISSRNASRTIEWNRMTKLKEVDGFLFFFTGKLLAISLPKEPLSNEQFEFIRSKMSER